MSGHPIRNAHEAWWFLHEHPKLQVRQRSSITEEETKTKIKRTRVKKDACGFWYREWLGLERIAVDENLDIHYAAVNEKGRVDDDKSKNVYSEVWLELGPLQWGYNSKPEWENCPAYLQHTHDIDLDCGAPTFDEALVKLAKKVKKKYGDFQSEPWHSLS